MRRAASSATRKGWSAASVVYKGQDQFTIEQLAGDLLPKPSLGQLIATGFNRNHMLNGEGGAIAAETQVEYDVDRVETTGTVWLGLTVGCARCHDHKYDPISQNEFYRLFAFFNALPERGGGNMEPTIKVPTPEQAAKIKQLETTSVTYTHLTLPTNPYVYNSFRSLPSHKQI